VAPASTSRARLQAALACGGALLLWWRIGGMLPAVFAIFLAALASLAWFAPARYAPVQRTLDRLMHALLAGLTWFVLGVVYFGVFTPLRAWRALMRRDPLQLRPAPAASSYLQPLPSGAPRRFDRQF